MNKNLNNYTKSELIALLESKKVDKSKEIDTNKTSKSITIWDIFYKFKIWILSLSVIAILSRFFKNYKSIRAILRLANYIFLTMFGISIFDAFGFGFIVKFLGELKYIFGGIVAYLTDSTFYNYLYKLFNVTEEKQSVRTIYKKPVETDWKAEFEKAERQREIEKWKERYEKHNEEKEGIDKTKSILLLLLVLGGSIGIWYYGKDALDVISPIWNVGNLIKRILRGNIDDDDNTPPTPPDIELDPNDGAISPGMLVYSSEVVAQESVDPIKSEAPIPPAPPAPPAPPKPITTELPEEVKINKLIN
jgi:hypothetical protein